MILQKCQKNKKEPWELGLGKYIALISRNKSGSHSTTTNETPLTVKKNTEVEMKTTLNSEFSMADYPLKSKINFSSFNSLTKTTKLLIHQILFHLTTQVLTSQVLQKTNDWLCLTMGIKNVHHSQWKILKGEKQGLDATWRPSIMSSFSNICNSTWS